MAADPGWETRAPAGLIIPTALLDTVIAHLRAALPNEGVGLLATLPEAADGLVRVVAFFPGTNLDASSTRYTMDPREVIVALAEIERRGWRLGAIAHAHPATPPVPSPTDRREAYYPMALTVIVSFATAPPTTRAWRMDEVYPIAADLVIDAAAPGEPVISSEMTPTGTTGAARPLRQGFGDR